VLAAVLISFISLYYYLRFLKAMFIEAPEQNEKLPVPTAALATVAFVSLLVLALGIYPNLLLDLVNQAQVIASN
jgi:NADH:ubiquinone oxidoreductase subunit 2 (subunit N)